MQGKALLHRSQLVYDDLLLLKNSLNCRVLLLPVILDPRLEILFTLQLMKLLPVGGRGQMAVGLMRVGVLDIDLAYTALEPSPSLIKEHAFH